MLRVQDSPLLRSAPGSSLSTRQYHDILDSDLQVHARAVFHQDEEEFSFTEVEFEVTHSYLRCAA